VRKLLILLELTGKLLGKECVKLCKSVWSFLGCKRKSAGLPALLVVVQPGSGVLEKYVDVKDIFYVAAKTQVQRRAAKSENGRVGLRLAQAGVPVLLG
jgi:hypothetical protein